MADRLRSPKKLANRQLDLDFASRDSTIRLGCQITEILVIGLRDPLPTFVLKCAEVDLSHVCLHSSGTLARWSTGLHVPRKGIVCLLREQANFTATSMNIHIDIDEMTMRTIIYLYAKDLPCPPATPARYCQRS